MGMQTGLRSPVSRSGSNSTLHGLWLGVKIRNRQGRLSQRVKGREETLHLVFATVALSLQVSFHVQKITFLAWWSCNIRRRMILVYTSEKMIQG
ncbi:hypothetical protein NC652_017550 [Populus alba x Populus x berolinensis]|uniref:Uncharacterized protein n=1 Tax=Populus alba x Populus x berolinensis TaxID=444605 RepID=A0AAD6QQ78_9ROSI|nr:hypothetical protein NC652_017550 [Populus alba x Populus x berolinensis]KAJ6994604.1 hypothetical protein NC653_017421 [Populus alba x Populus x berolinensis]